MDSMKSKVSIYIIDTFKTDYVPIKSIYTY